VSEVYAVWEFAGGMVAVGMLAITAALIWAANWRDR
jgi:hypothetical protein